MNDDLFSKPAAQRRTQARKSRAPADAPRAGSEDYDASAIEVLEGLEPVRRRPGMYIGGTDETAYHHLASEILDNAMDEAVAGHASVIDVSLEAGNWLTIRDNGRGIPVDPHPKFPQRSALEVILTTLHAGGKFSGKAYATSGGLHGVGSSVVNALSARMEVEIARDRTVWQQVYERGIPLAPIEEVGPTQNRRGTQIRFVPDPQIFGKLHFSPLRLYRLCRSKAFLFRGVTIRWSCDPALIKGTDVPAESVLHFPGGLADSLRDELGNTALLTDIWAGDADLPTAVDGESTGRMEWAIAFVERGTTGLSSYCNTIPTPNGGTHETGFRTALTKGLRNWGEQRSNKRAATINADDIMGLISAKLSVFIRDPQFQGQTKEKLTSGEASRLVETALRELPADVTAVGLVSGGSTWQIIRRAQVSEALPAIVAAIVLNLISMIEYSAIAGTIGAGGIGYLAVVYGYQRFDNHIMIATILVLIATIQLIQFTGDRLVAALQPSQGS